MNYNGDTLYHHGIPGQKWGVRRYQNPDGSLTSEGRQRYGYSSETESYRKGLKEATINGGLIGRAIYKNKNKEAAARYRNEKQEIKARKKADAETDQKETVKKYIKAEDKAWKASGKLNAQLNKVNDAYKNVSKIESEHIAKTGYAFTKAGEKLIKETDKYLKQRSLTNKYWEEAGNAYKATGKNVFDRLARVNKFKDVALSELKYNPQDHGINPNVGEKERKQHEEYKDAYDTITGSSKKRREYEQKYGRKGNI